MRKQQGPAGPCQAVVNTLSPHHSLEARKASLLCLSSLIMSSPITEDAGALNIYKEMLRYQQTIITKKSRKDGIETETGKTKWKFQDTRKYLYFYYTLHIS